MKQINNKYNVIQTGDLVLTYKGNTLVRFIKNILNLNKDMCLACVSDGILMIDRKCEVYRTKKTYSKLERKQFKDIIINNVALLDNKSLIFTAVNTVRYDTFDTSFELEDIRYSKYYKHICNE